MAYELIETIEVGAAGAASMEFTSIPQDGVDLVLVVSARYVNNSRHGDVTINGTSTGYTSLRLQGSGSAVSTNSFPLNDLPNLLGVGNPGNATSNTFGNTQITFSNYTSAANKSVAVDGVSENNATEAYQLFYAGSWSNTDAITSIAWSNGASNIVQYSTASLYKIY